MSLFVPPFRVGDLVRVRDHTDTNWSTNEKHIIMDVNVMGVNDYDYGTTAGAWIPHEELVLVEACSPATIQKLMGHIAKENGLDDD
jgi:hypothetical protein